MLLRIGITGGSGFIGTHVANVLKSKYEVMIFDHHKPKIEDIEFIKGNIIDDSVRNAFEDCDVVIHLAAAVGVKTTEEDPILTLNTNILGTKNVLEACKSNNVKKIILASSSEVYGEPLKTPIEESDPAIPITGYGVSKIAAEEYVKAYAVNFGLPLQGGNPFWHDRVLEIDATGRVVYTTLSPEKNGKRGDTQIYRAIVGPLIPVAYEFSLNGELLELESSSHVYDMGYDQEAQEITWYGKTKAHSGQNIFGH